MSDAYSPETLARQIVVRYRGTGHVRFALPAALCDEACAAAIKESLRILPGIYRVNLYRSLGKLSVYYDQHACGLHDVARRLYAALASPAAQQRGAAAPMAQRLHVAQPLQWLKDKTGSLKAKAADLKTKAKLLSHFAAAQTQGKPVLQSLLSEKSVINFLNDVVVFYLIKTHWEMINQKWLKQPLQYRSAWLATFYLVFLLVRYRKQSAKKP